MSTDTHSLAASVLGLAPGATADEAASAFLRVLPGIEFVPPADAVAALNALAGTALPADPDGETEPGLSFAEQVDEFARRFWSLPPVGRLAAWVALGDRAPDDATAARLIDLQPGLEVPADALPDPVAEEVAALARELFVLPPRERAIRRNEWLLANAARHADLSRAATELHRLWPTLTALEPLLLARLEPWFKAATFAEAANAEPRHPPRGRSQPIHITIPERFAEYPRPATEERDARFRWRAGVFFWSACALPFILVVLVSIRRHPDRPIPTYPTIKLNSPAVPTPSFPSSVPPGGVFSFTPEEVKAFDAYRRRPEGVPPPLFAFWVLAGCPKAGEPVTFRPRPPVLGKER